MEVEISFLGSRESTVNTLYTLYTVKPLVATEPQEGNFWTAKAQTGKVIKLLEPAEKVYGDKEGTLFLLPDLLNHVVLTGKGKYLKASYLFSQGQKVNLELRRNG